MAKKEPTKEEIDNSLINKVNVSEEQLIKKKKKRKKKKKDAKPEKGVETWFRLASRNLYTRLQIVDTKANILITANAIIISVVLGSLYPRLDEDWHLIYAIVTIVTTNIASIAYAILATIPKNYKSSKSDLVEMDLMTFDGFQNMEFIQYKDNITTLLEKKDTLYPSIIKDIHNLGLALSRKYRLIRIAYLIFLYGIILSAFVFGACHAFF